MSSRSSTFQVKSILSPIVFILATVFSLVVSSELFAQQTSKLVFDFESGDLAKEGWRIVEGENTKPIGSREYAYNQPSSKYQKHGEHYLTTLETSYSDAPNDDPQSIIESPVFKIEGDKISLLVGGASSRENVRVELDLLNDDYSIVPVAIAKGDNSEALVETIWDVAQYKGRLAVIRAIDLETGSWAHIRCDYIQIDGRLVPEVDAKLAAKREKDKAEALAKAEAERKAAFDALPDAILYVRRSQYAPDHHNSATIFQYGEINTGSFRGSSALVVWFKETDETKTLLELPDGIVRDPSLSFDAKKVIFSFRRCREDDYHIAEMTLDLDRPTIVIKGDATDADLAKIDGFKQLTFVKGASDIDPLYLPTGEIVFSSTREPKYCMCNRHIMCNLHKMNADGSNIEQIGKSTLFEGHSALLSDGRIIYDRWEYVDRNFGDAQGVWVANPDGSKHEIYWGNNTASPGGVIDAKPMPGDDSVFVCTFSSTHDRPWGAIAIVDRRLAIDGRDAVLQMWPPEEIDWVDSKPGEDPFTQVVKYDTFIKTPLKFEDPFPLEDGGILASGQFGNGEEMGIYLLTEDGKSMLVHKDAPGCFDPQPILETEPPKTIADRVNLDDQYGYFHVSNVYEGFGMENVPKGAVKYLRVVESPEKRFWTHALWDMNGTGTQAPGMNWEDYSNKRILGTVPVAEDGSVSFAVPAEKFLYFQLLDENKMMIQSMRSGIMARPGETNACVGCHESRIDAPTSGTLAGAANSGEPQKLEPWFGEPRYFSYATEVQPVFDKYCVACHDFGRPAGEKLVLAGDRNPIFNESYWNIQLSGLVRAIGVGPHNTQPPYSWGSTQSRLTKIFTEGHPNKDVDAKRKELGLFVDKESDPEAYERIITWIDINTPYYPTFGSAYRDNPHGRSPLTEQETLRLQELTGMKAYNGLMPKQKFGDNILTPAISFDRPEMSPCLDRWEAANALDSPEYKEALEIIKKGQERLNAQGRGEEEDFQPVADVEVDQQKRYEYFQKRAQAVRDAKKNGKTLNDLEVDEIVGKTWRQ